MSSAIQQKYNRLVLAQSQLYFCWMIGRMPVHRKNLRFLRCIAACMSTQANKDIQHIGRKSMIHEDRVRQMIKLAVYDENKSMGEKKPAQYFRKDYLALEMIKSFFCGTMAYAIIVILGAVYLLGNGAGDISTVNFIRILILTVVLYAVFLGIYLVLTYSIYSARYEKGRKASREYYHTLKRVNEMYRQEDTAKTPEEWL